MRQSNFPNRKIEKQATVKRLLDERAMRSTAEQLRHLDVRVGPDGAKKERARLLRVQNAAEEAKVADAALAAKRAADKKAKKEVGNGTKDN